MLKFFAWPSVAASSLRPQERRDILVRLLRAGQDAGDGRHARAAVRFVLQHRRQAMHLAEVLLRQPNDPVAGCMQLAVEALYAQHPPLSEVLDGRARHRQPESLQQLHAQPLVLHRGTQVCLPVADQAERQLQDVGRRRRAVRHEPPVAVAQERRLLLGAGNGEPELIVRILSRQRRRQHAFQVRCDLRVGHPRAFDLVEANRLFAVGQELHRAGTVPAYGLEQVEGLQRARLEAVRKPLADLVAVRQQVVEVAFDRLALEGRTVHPEGQ
jgi:hypothetical protein